MTFPLAFPLAFLLTLLFFKSKTVYRLTNQKYNLDALYPKEFCVANPVLVSAKGCQKYLADICSLDVKLALSPPCAGLNLISLNYFSLQMAH